MTTVGTETEGAVGALSWSNTVIRVLILIGEVLLDDVVCLHVNLLVGIGLALVDLLHATALFNEQSVTVDGVRCIAGCLLIQITDLEYVLEAIKSDLDNLVVGAGQEVAQGLDATLGDKVPDLVGLLEATTGRVANGPASLLAGLQVTVGQQVDERWDNVGIDDGLDLSGVSGCDVGNGPARLLANAILVRAQEGQQTRQGTAVDDNLSLYIITGNNVSDRAQSRSLNGCRSVHQQLNEATWNASLNNSLDFVVGTIRKVGDCPAGIDQNFVIEGVNQLGQDGKSRCNLEDNSLVLG